MGHFYVIKLYLIVVSLFTNNEILYNPLTTQGFIVKLQCLGKINIKQFIVCWTGLHNQYAKKQDNCIPVKLQKKKKSD